MKKVLLYSLLASACCLPLSSCSLEERSSTEMEKKHYMNNADEAEDVLLGVYATNVSDAMYAYNLSILFALGTDIAQVEGANNENFRIIPTNSFPTTQSEVQATWAALYTGIYRANDFLERVAVKMHSFGSDDEKALATIYIAEARALRAMFYFELVRRYGNVPLITTTAQASQTPETYVQADPVEIYKQIEADLRYACDVLPYAADDTYRANNAFRFSKGAALGLLAKVYATWAGQPIGDSAKWELAANTARVLIESGKHALLPSYQTLWENTCNSVWDPTESLIEISFYSPTGTSGSDPVGRVGKWNGVKTTAIAGIRGSCAGNVKVVHSFVLDWRAAENSGDLRRDLSVANYLYNNDYILYAASASDSQTDAQAKDADATKAQKGKQNYTPAKWDIEKYVTSGKLINNDKSNVNWYVLRYADVLLLYAEALNEWHQRPTDEAYAAVNAVRRRGFGNPANTSACDLPAGLDTEAFRQAVRKERAYELAFEGHRRHDLIRWGVYYETIQQTKQALASWWTTDSSDFNYVVARFTVKGKHELFPIPQRELDLCKQFRQNPNW
ncbi:MAG: RagB/SusD family nutrient uptake outer membrane protein [Mediterranea sp.]|jgi:hypothetical protein|nr:RagB/SusD family nutrient uptake outer membrane protein [Mediterranea sp.]